MNQKTNQVDQVSTQLIPSSGLQIETRTGIFSELKTRDLIIWFMGFLLSKATDKCIANAYRTGDETVMTLLLKNTHIHISVLTLNEERAQA